MKSIMKKNQVIITVLAVMIAIAGYLTYAGRVEIENPGNDAKEAAVNYEIYAASDRAQDQITTTEAAENEKAVNGTGTQGNELTDVNSLDLDIDDPGEAVLANGLTVSDYLAQSKLAREQTRGKNREDLLAIIDSDLQNPLDKQAAIDTVVRLSDYSDRENAAETLLRAKGFEHSIVSITDNEVDVIICKDNLTDAELAQVEDVVKRKAAVEASQICITLMGTGE